MQRWICFAPTISCSNSCKWSSLWEAQSLCDFAGGKASVCLTLVKSGTPRSTAFVWSFGRAPEECSQVCVLSKLRSSDLFSSGLCGRARTFAADLRASQGPDVYVNRRQAEANRLRDLKRGAQTNSIQLLWILSDAARARRARTRLKRTMSKATKGTSTLFPQVSRGESNDAAKGLLAVWKSKFYTFCATHSPTSMIQARLAARI